MATKVKKIAANVSDKLAHELVGHTVDLMRFSEGARNRLVPRLTEMRDEIAGKLIGLESSTASSTREKTQRLQSLFSTTERTIRTAYRDLRDAHLDELVPLSKLESRFVPRMFNQVFNVNLIDVSFSPEQLKTIAKKSLIRGSVAEEWWGRQATSLRQSFEDQVRMGYMQGETISNLVQRVRGTSTGKPGQFTGGIMDTGTRQAEALVRTSVQTVANDVQSAIYNDNDDLIKGLQALATLDGRTTIICRTRDGHAWYLDTFEPIAPTDEPWPGRPPYHWQCRTVLIPLTYSWEELSQGGKKEKALARKIDRATADGGIRASMDGAVSSTLKYEDWLGTRPVAEQKDILGPGRYNLWTKGDLTFEQMVDQRGNPLTIAEIEARQK